MSIDLQSLVRKRKPAKHLVQLRRRSPENLVDLAQLRGNGPHALVLDTNVYINRAAGRIDVQMRDIIDRTVLFHCSTALAELAVGIGNADPTRPAWNMLRDHYCSLFTSVPPSRVLVPDARIWADGGLIAGMIARTQKFMPYQRAACLNDALIFLTAAKAGIPVLTANRDDFDFIQQIAKDGSFIYYSTCLSPA